MKHTEYFRVNSHDTDHNGIVRPSMVLRYMQETGNLQFQSNHPNLYELNEDGKSFLLSRVTFISHKPLHNFEDIKVDSWACDGTGAAFIRCAQIHRGDELIAELISTWALIERDTHRFLRHGDIAFQFGTDEPLEIDAQTRVVVPKELELQNKGQREVYYGDIDLYGHMNNTNYPDMLCAFLPSLVGKMVKQCVINFLNEAPLGCTFDVLRANIDDEYYFRTIKQDGTTGIQAKIVLGDIQ